MSKENAMKNYIAYSIRADKNIQLKVVA